MKNFFNTYIFLILVAFGVGILYVLKTIDSVALNTTAKKISFVIYGIGSSMLTTWIVFEICIYFNLPSSLSVSIGGGAGFIGAECLARFALDILGKKLGK